MGNGSLAGREGLANSQRNAPIQFLARPSKNALMLALCVVVYVGSPNERFAKRP